MDEIIPNKTPKITKPEKTVIIILYTILAIVLLFSMIPTPKQDTIEFQYKDQSASVFVTIKYRKHNLALGEISFYSWLEDKAYDTEIFNEAMRYQIDQVDLNSDNAEEMLKTRISENLTALPVRNINVDIKHISDWYRADETEENT